MMYHNSYHPKCISEDHVQGRNCYRMTVYKKFVAEAYATNDYTLKSKSVHTQLMETENWTLGRVYKRYFALMVPEKTRMELGNNLFMFWGLHPKTSPPGAIIGAYVMKDKLRVVVTKPVNGVMTALPPWEFPYLSDRWIDFYVNCGLNSPTRLHAEFIMDVDGVNQVNLQTDALVAPHEAQMLDPNAPGPYPEYGPYNVNALAENYGFAANSEEQTLYVQLGAQKWVY